MTEESPGQVDEGGGIKCESRQVRGCGSLRLQMKPGIVAWVKMVEEEVVMVVMVMMVTVRVMVMVKNGNDDGDDDVGGSDRIIMVGGNGSSSNRNPDRE